MPESNYLEVRELDLFKNIKEERLRALLRSSYVQSFPVQIQLIEEGDPSDFLHIMLSGAVDLFAGWNQRETSIATIRPGSSFILAATIRDAPYLMSARTLEKSRVVLVPSQIIRTVFEEDAEFARAVVTELAQSYRYLVKNTKELRLRTSLERLANYLLRHQKRVGGAADFELETEKRRLASFLGMTPENLSRAFKGLQPYGVCVAGNRVSITDQGDLERFAKPSALIDDHTI